MAERFRPNVVATKLTSECYHPRGMKPRLVVLHSTESHNRAGSSDIVSILSYFTGNNDASSTVVVDGEGQSGRSVADGDAPFTQCAYNRPSLSVEMVGQAAQTEWPEAQVKEVARWIARWSFRYGIPIRRARTIGGRVLLSGVTTHKRLGTPGCGHSDPGSAWPMGHCLDLASHYLKLYKENA